MKKVERAERCRWEERRVELGAFKLPRGKSLSKRLLSSVCPHCSPFVSIVFVVD